MGRVFTVTCDINADYKKLKNLQNKGIINVARIRIENNSNKVGAILPTIVLGKAVLGLAFLGSAEQRENFKKLKKIILPNNINDCIHLEAHIRDKRDYFVTEDRDILDKKGELEEEFPNLKIRTVDDLYKELENN